MNFEKPSNIEGDEKKPRAEEEVEPEEIPEGASDMEVAEFLAGHIDNPCEVEVAPGQVENIRDFYIREAKKLLPKITDLEAKRLLELKMQEYKDK